MRQEPVRWLAFGVSAALAVLTALLTTGALSANAAVYVTAAVTILTALSGELARRHVTPLANPRDKTGAPLVPGADTPPWR